MKLFLRSFSSLPLIYSRRDVVSYKRKYVHKLLVNRLFKPAQEKVWLGELTVAVDLGRKATKSNKTNKQLDSCTFIYSKCSKIVYTYLNLFSNKSWLSRLEITKFTKCLSE